MPIIGGKYENPGWVDNTSPAIDAAELNDICDTVEGLDDAVGGIPAAYVQKSNVQSKGSANTPVYFDGSSQAAPISSPIPVSLGGTGAASAAAALTALGAEPKSNVTSKGNAGLPVYFDPDAVAQPVTVSSLKETLDIDDLQTAVSELQSAVGIINAALNTTAATVTPSASGCSFTSNITFKKSNKLVIFEWQSNVTLNRKGAWVNIGTIPSGYRPSSTFYVDVAGDVSNGALPYVHYTVRLDSNGLISLSTSVDANTTATIATHIPYFSS